MKLDFRVSSVLLCLLAACGGGGGSSTGEIKFGNGIIQGNLAVLQSSGTIGEAEPNDTASQAHQLGTLSPGDAIGVLGSVEDASGTDTLDAYRLILPARSRVGFDLTSVGASGATDFVLAVFDAVSLQSVELFDSTTAGAESGDFVASGAIFVGVLSASGSSAYQLELTVTALENPIGEREPNDVSGQAQFLGTLSSTESISVAGALSPTDASDRFLVACPEGGVLSFVADAAQPGGDYDVRFRDATANLEVPTLIQSFESPNDPETGFVNLAAMTLVEVEVFPFAGAGDYALELSLNAGVPPGASAAAASGVPVASLSARPRGTALSFGRRSRVPGLSRFVESSGVPMALGDVLVAFHDEADVARLGAYGGSVADAIPGGAKRVRFGLPSTLSLEMRERYTTCLANCLAADPAVRYAEPNQYYQAFNEPNDTYYNLQWHYQLIQLPAAWDLTTGSPDVIVSVIDTGSAPATDLVPRTIPGFDMISDPSISGDGNGYDTDSLDVGDAQSPFQNSSFHGAHVAGTIGAATNDGFGVAGVTWSGGIMHVRALGVGGGSTFDIANAIRYSAGLPNSSGALPLQAADIINMSLGGPGVSQTMQDACTAARNAGSLLIAAAGNENSGGNFSPAVLDGVISVGAVDARSVKAPYSNFHPTLDIAAPGGDVTADRTGDGYPDGVLSNRPRDTVSPTNYDVFEFYQGTSMAAPHVAGVAALCLAVNPSLTVPELESILTSTATDLGSPGRDDIYGHGLVNAFAAVQAASGPPVAGPPELSLTDTDLLFSSTDCFNVSVANVGSDTLSITDLVPTTDGGGAWLSAQALAIATPLASDTSSIEVCVDASGLATGTYTGSVLVSSNGGDAAIGVTLVVGGKSQADPLDVFVLAVDVETLETKAQDVVTVPAAFAYELDFLDPGLYLVVAGTDADDDGFICDEGEPLCGIFPTVEDPSLIEVTDGGTVIDVDFPVLEGFFTAAGADAAGPTGYRLLTKRGGVR